MSAERREYFRINDILPLYHSAVPAPSVDEQSSDPRVLLSALEPELNDAVNRVFRDDPVTGQALGLLNRKISLISATLPGQDAMDNARHVPTRVSLSGSGIAFDNDKCLTVGSRRRLSVLLQPSQVPVKLDCTVLESVPADSEDQSCWIRLAFDPDDVSREQIIRYVVQRQAMQRAGGELQPQDRDSDPEKGR